METKSEIRISKSETRLELPKRGNDQTVVSVLLPVLTCAARSQVALGKALFPKLCFEKRVALPALSLAEGSPTAEIGAFPSSTWERGTGEQDRKFEIRSTKSETITKCPRTNDRNGSSEFWSFPCLGESEFV